MARLSESVALSSQSDGCKQCKYYRALEERDSDRSNSQRHVALSSPNLTACDPWVFFVDAQGALEAQSDRRAQTNSLGEVMTGHRSVGEKKNNELMMTHRRHMLPCLLSRMRTRKFINFLWDQESQQGYSSQKPLLKGQFTLSSLHMQPHSFHSIFQCPSYLVSTDTLSKPQE